jgi:hypothetical protein
MSGPISAMPVIALRCDMIGGTLAASEETREFGRFVRAEMKRCAEQILAHAPAYCDVGRVIAFLDQMQSARDTVCAAAVIGGEANVRSDARRRERENESARECDELSRKLAQHHANITQLEAQIFTLCRQRRDQGDSVELAEQIRVAEQALEAEIELAAQTQAACGKFVSAAPQQPPS